MKILITGATNGMGKGVAKILAGMDQQAHEIIILCRSKERGVATIKEFEGLGNTKASMVLCDLMKLDDVKKAIEQIKSQHDFLDSLFINAGIGYAPKRVETVDGMDAHFQVNYLSQFMLTLHLLDLLEKSENGGRVIFNATNRGELFWDDLQMTKKWGYVRGIYQAMAAKRMFIAQLHTIYRHIENSKMSFTGFQISKTVWTNQINIIPSVMRIMATLMKFFGTFISIETCGQIMAPLFLEPQEDSLKKSGKLITWKKDAFIEMAQDKSIFGQEMLDKLWGTSLELCKDEKTTQLSEALMLRSKRQHI